MDTSIDLVNRAVTATGAEGVGGVPSGAARRIRCRGDARRRAVTPADSLSRLAADELVALGMPATTAASAARQLTEEEWARVVAGSGDGRRFFLVAEAAGDGGALAVSVVDEAKLGEHLGRGALAVDLTSIAEAASMRLGALLAIP